MQAAVPVGVSVGVVDLLEMVHIKIKDGPLPVEMGQVVLIAPPVDEFGQAVHLLDEVAVELVKHDGRDRHAEPCDIQLAVHHLDADPAHQKQRHQNDQDAAAGLIPPERLHPPHQKIQDGDKAEKGIDPVERRVIIHVGAVHAVHLPRAGSFPQILWDALLSVYCFFRPPSSHGNCKRL